ncbi:MAG: hypothetical protein ACYTBV_13720 [Planctomycetota bacterium]|jgi:hypothetical protein
MELFLLHFSFIARGDGDWFNILIFAVVIGIGVIKSIYNAQAEKKAKDASREDSRNLGSRKAESRKPPSRPVERISRKASKKEAGFTLETGSKKPSVKPRPVRRPVSRPVQAAKPVKKLSSGLIPSSSAARKYVDSERIIQKTLGEVTKQEKQVAKPISGMGMVSQSIGADDFMSDSLLSIGSSDLIFDEPSGEGAAANLPELSSRDSLRKAILYYEILGKPLSERESGGHQIF